MKFLNYLVLLALISCSTGESRQNIENGGYRSSGVEQFFLPEVPTWANYSASGKCFKKSSFQYLDFKKLAGSYKLTYLQMVELQAQFNHKLEEYFKSSSQRFLKPVEEASFFSNTLEQVRGGVRQFKLPPVPEVEVLWLEGYLQKNDVAALRKLAAKGRFDSKLPILFSTCHTKESLNQWVIENTLDQTGFYLLAAEYLSPYSSENKLEAGLRIELDKLVNPGVKIFHFQEQIPVELIIQ